MLTTTPAPTIDDALRLHRGGQLPEAAKMYRQILSGDPQNADALHLLGVIAQNMGQLEDAVELIAASLRIAGKNVSAINNLAGVLKDQGKLDEAVEFYRTALELNPQADHVQSNLGNVLKDLRQFPEAAECYQRALEINPESTAAHCNLGTLFREQGHLDEAIACYRRALALDAACSEAHSNLGIALKEQGKLDEAIVALACSLQLNPKSGATLTSLGAALKEAGRVAEAIDCYWRALELKPRSHLALNNLGNALKEQGKYAEAVKCFQQALACQPEFHLAHNNLGSALCELGQVDAALQAFDRALECRPDYAPALSNRLFTLNYRAGTDPAQLFAEHLRFEECFAQALPRSPHENSRDPERRLKIGYVSGDFREHSVALFIEPVLAGQDRAQFEVFCYANQFIEDDVTRRLRAASAHWRTVIGLSDEALAAQIRADGIDILVDLSGHTARHRLLVFARKPAPVQVTMIGYMQTTGLRAMDYRITDERLDPIGVTDAFGTEKLVRLLSGAATLQPPADCPEVGALPALTNGHVTFASFNNLAKVTPAALAAWARILHAVPGSRLVAVGRAGNGIVAALGAHGIAAERIGMLERLPFHDYLALHQRVDFLLDTFPYCGGTTTMLGLWMGIPFVTLAGQTPTSRAGADMLTGVGLGHELIAESEAEYVEKAVHAVSNFPQLAHWRADLRPRLAPLLGTGAGHVRELEFHFRAMWREWCALPPAA